MQQHPYKDSSNDTEHTKAQQLDGKETVYVDGDRYEAFNTSGGASSMCKTFEGKIKSLSYKTIRYPGHCDKMQFLLEDLNLKHNKQKFVELFDQELPYTTQDVIVMVISVIGKINGKMIEKAYHKKIYGNKSFSGIQNQIKCEDIHCNNKTTDSLFSIILAATTRRCL